MSKVEKYCCTMRRYFLLGIVGNRAEPVPFDVMEFMPDVQANLIVIKFCPFCGVELDNTQAFRVTGEQPDGNDTPS